jgi:tetratricopeptide (TPR) repeat protein
LLEGMTLREWIEGGSGRGTPDRLRELLDFAIQIAEGLEAAHLRGIIHRDIKPANIFVTRRNQVKILDFGVATFVESAEAGTAPPERVGSGTEPSIASHPTRTAASLGTPSYLSPEQICREKLDTRTDLFSFGLVLYEMATSQRAFSGSTTTVIRDAVLQMPAVAVHQLSPDVPPELERIISKALVKDRELRWQTAREMAEELHRIQVAPAAVAMAGPAGARRPPNVIRRNFKKILVGAALLLVAGGIAAGLRYRSLRASQLNARDTVVLTDFSNNTGDAVFDDTLKQALKVSLSQSPFLNILSDRKVRATLKLMTQPTNTPMSPSLAREVCQRSGSKAYIAGAIASLDTDYVIGLKAENCLNGTTLASEQVTAHTKDEVIPVLGQAATRLRSRLGESIATVRKFDVPLRQATTGSLQALKEYTDGGVAENDKGPVAAIPHYKQAIALDPLFARAYSALAGEYFDAGESELSAAMATKAFELRDRATELEKTQIEASYHSFTTGNLEKAARAYEAWARLTPWYPGPHSNLAYVYGTLGWNDKALSESLEGLRLGESGEAFTNVMSSYVALGRLEEAKASFAQAESHHANTPLNHTSRYLVGFLEHDRAAMDREIAYAKETPEIEAWMLYFESCTSSYYGQMRMARELSGRAAASTLANNQKETAAAYRADLALHEALFGNAKIAKQEIQKALATSVGPDVRAAAALTYAFAGDMKAANVLADQLAKRYPDNTIVQKDYLPAIRAHLAILNKKPAEAVEELEPARPYEFGQPAQAILLNMYPVYVRGEAYLAAHDARAAQIAFQEILDHPGSSLNEAIAALAHLGVARALTLQGDKDRARSAYQELFSIWKNADAEIPVLKQARSEFARLQ